MLIVASQNGLTCLNGGSANPSQRETSCQPKEGELTRTFVDGAHWPILPGVVPCLWLEVLLAGPSGLLGMEEALEAHLSLSLGLQEPSCHRAGS